jgi:hypothetical protein
MWLGRLDKSVKKGDDVIGHEMRWYDWAGRRFLQLRKLVDYIHNRCRRFVEEAGLGEANALPPPPRVAMSYGGLSAARVQLMEES